MVDLRRDARLVEEHRDELGVLGELGMQALRGDDAREALVAHEARDVDRRHTAARDLAMQQIAADRDLVLRSLGSLTGSFASSLEELDRNAFAPEVEVLERPSAWIAVPHTDFEYW